MTSLRKHSQRLAGKLNTTHSRTFNYLPHDNTTGADYFSDIEKTAPSDPTDGFLDRRADALEAGIDDDGLDVIEDPRTEVVEAWSVRSLASNALTEAIPLCRGNKDGTPNKADLKREMKKRGFTPTGRTDLVNDLAWIRV
jgi:hypothetical protein